MTSRGNQSVSPPAQIPQQRHVNTVSSGTPPPQYFTGPSSGFQQVGFQEFLPQGQAAYLPYQTVSYGNSINEIRGPPGNNGRAGPIQQSLQQGFYQQMGSHMRPQQMPQGPTANQQGFINTQGSGAYCQPRPQSQPSQFVYYGNFQPGSNVYALPTMYGGHQAVSVYPQNHYMPAYQPNMQSYHQNGLQWRSQGLSPTGAPYTNRPQPRERKVIDITDPTTGRNITDELFRNKALSADAEDVYEQAPPVNKNQEIRQTFTRLVAECLKSPDEPGSLEAAPDSQGAVGGSPTGPSVTSQQYQQPPPQQQVVHQLPHPQQQQPQQSKGLPQMMRAPMNGSPPTMQHQVMPPPRPGMIQHPPASETPPQDIHNQLMNFNLSMPPPHLHMNQSTQPMYNSAPQQQHHIPHHQQQTPQQQSIRPSMLPTPLQQIQSQQHYTPPPNQSPPYTQIPRTNIPHHSIPQPFKADLVLPEKQQIAQAEAPSQSNIPSLVSGPVPTQPQPPRAVSPVRDATPGPTAPTEQIGDMKSNLTHSSLKTSFGEDERMDTLEDGGKEEVSQGANLQGVKDVRKSKKNLKDLNRKDIGGSDMDAFIDNGDATISDTVNESDTLTSNNELESSSEPASNNDGSVSDNVSCCASLEGDLAAPQGASESKDSQMTKSQEKLTDAELRTVENGQSQDNENDQKSRQKLSTAPAQVDVKSKQKKKKKKGQQNLPVPKSKQSTAPSDVTEKQNETAETPENKSADSGNTDLEEKPATQQVKPSGRQDKTATLQDKPSAQIDKPSIVQDKPVVQQDKPKPVQDTPTVRQDKSAVRQDKSAVRQEKSATPQDAFVPPEKSTTSQVKSSQKDRSTPPSSPSPTQITKTAHKDPLPQSPAPVSEPQQCQAEDISDKAFLIEDRTTGTTPSAPTNSVMLDSNRSSSGNQTQQASSSIQANHVSLEQSNHSDSVAPAESPKTADSPQVNDLVFDDKPDSLLNSTLNHGGDSQRELIDDGDIDATFRKPLPDKTGGKVKRGGKEKLQYDRAYLMELRECPSSQTKPEGLPDLPDIILNLPLASANRAAAPLDFTPSFFQNTGSIRNASQVGSKTNSRSRQRTDVQMPQRIIKSVSLQSSVKPLHQSEKPWKPTPKQLSEGGEVGEKRKTLESEVLFIMNRLTPTNFERLAEEMKALDIKTTEDLKELVKIFFDKVTIETKFVEAYAMLCKVMSGVKVHSPSSTGAKDPATTTFRVAMLTKCQQEFEADKTAIFEDPEERRKKMEEEISADNPERAARIDKALYDMKMRRLKFYGNVRFIGELFKLKMLTENIMHDCIYRLLRAKDDDSLVSLCNLIATVGQALDTEKAKPKMEQYFAQMAKIADERKSRIKFTLKDIIDLRNNNWVPRKEQTAPKKIDEVHKDFQQEQATKQFLQSQPLPPRMESSQSNPKRGSRQRQDEKQQLTDDGWNTVGSKSLRIDVSKMRLSKNVVDENSIQLGPGGGMKQFSMWGKGSYGGTQPSQEHERSPAGNRFSALKFEEDRRSHQRSPTRGDGGSRSARHGPMGGQGQGKVLARSSQEGERRDALANARSIAGGMSHDSSRESSRNREDSRQSVSSRDGDSLLARSNGSQRASSDVHQSRTSATFAPSGAAPDDQAVKKMKPLSEEEMEQKARTILEEYLNAMDLEEAKLCMMELEGQRHLTLFVTTCINDVLEKSYKNREQTGVFFHQMIKNQLLPLDVYFRGLAGVLEFAEDMVIDIPKIWTYLAQIIVPVLDDASVTWPKLATALKGCLDRRCCAKLIAEILLIAREMSSEVEVAEMWQGNRMDWATLLEPDQVRQFLKDKRLEFTVQPVAAKALPRAGDSSQTGLQKLVEDVEHIVRRSGSNGEIRACIDKYAGPQQDEKSLIRALVTAIVSASVIPSTKKLREDLFKSHSEVLQHYIQNQVGLELQALYAIQALMHKLEHPSGVIAQIFTILYDEEVISEDAIKQWEKSVDPYEAEGKGPCFLQLTQFFAWLRENEDPEAS